VRRPAGLASLASHSGGDGAPPGPIMRPCQELADDLFVALPAFGLLERDKTAPGVSGLVGRGATAPKSRTQAKAGPVRSLSRRK